MLFDRSEFSQLTNLFDKNAKYGTVITLKDVLQSIFRLKRQSKQEEIRWVCQKKLKRP